MSTSPLNETVRVMIAGAAGRMGRRLVALAGEHRAFQLAAALEHAGHRDLGRDSGELAGAGRNRIPLQDHTATDFDVLVDFSLPVGTMHWLDFCLQKKRALVTGVTGLTPEHLHALEKAAQKIPVLQAPNMSLGINLMLRLVRQAASAVGE